MNNDAHTEQAETAKGEEIKTSVREAVNTIVDGGAANAVQVASVRRCPAGPGQHYLVPSAGWCMDVDKT
jgi:hypothetical protein